MPEPLQVAGVLPVIQTPFTDHDDIDYTALSAEIEWVIEQGADGVTVGMVSEIIRLTSAERRDLASAVCEAASGTVSVISCGAESTIEAVRLAAHAESMGATSLMAIPPVHVGLPDASLVEYYAAIMQATAIPLVVQDASGYVGRPMSPAVLVRLYDMFGNRVYAKPEAVPIGPSISAIREATQGHVRVFEGAGGSALTDTFRRGIDGTMPAADVCWAVRAIWDALEAGDDETAYRVSGPLCALISLQTELDAFVAIEKHLLCRQHVISSRRQRGPLGYIPDDQTLAEADRLFDRLAAAVSEAAPNQPMP
jgi:dihydrodipicolinate synthase/N-acetylneuraminate lyase